MPNKKSNKRSNKQQKRVRKTVSNRGSVTEHIHPSIQIQPSTAGLGVFASQPIRKHTVIVRETPHHLPNEPYDHEYPFKLARHVLSIDPEKFSQLVPHQLNSDATCNVESTPKFTESASKFFPGVDHDTVKLYVLKIRRNAFQFGRVSGILFFATRMNHSCVPNVRYERRGNQMVFRTKRDIDSGEEIHDTYIYPGDSYQKRQSDLLARYGFKCGCSNCSRNFVPTSTI
jgi:SET domain-containing protein